MSTMAGKGWSSPLYPKSATALYRIAEMFDGVNVWRIAKLKEIGKIKFGELIDFGYKMPNFDWLKFGESRTTCQICQPPLYGSSFYSIQ